MDPRVNVFYWSLFAPDPDAAIIEGRSQEHFQNSHNLIVNPQILKFSLFNNKSGAESQISQQSDFHENYEDSKKSNRAFFVAAWFSSRLLNFFLVGDTSWDRKRETSVNLSQLAVSFDIHSLIGLNLVPYFEIRSWICPNSIDT